MAVAGAAVVLAAPAHADDDDAIFLQVIHHYGITFPTNASAVSAARFVCSQIDSGWTPAEVSMKVYNITNKTVTADDAGYFVGASVAAYCPEYKDQL
ncbi:hypothetical protein MTY66_47810 [Mycolicibacterium sp. TY66]|nr:hypothetical protein MTY66_47810 [Mycolicibacterium sp. TY66]BCJ79197.1 hypothetical protein MTY81_05700 [Mycolicibacterium sp. TY81]